MVEFFLKGVFCQFLCIRIGYRIPSCVLASCNLLPSIAGRAVIDEVVQTPLFRCAQS